MKNLSGGVTFSGGEPLMQPEFLIESLKSCKAVGIHSTIDTSGYASFDAIKEAAAYTDLFLFDLKLMNDDDHRKLHRRFKSNYPEELN